jgi:hypothetical protein
VRVLTNGHRKKEVRKELKEIDDASLLHYPQVPEQLAQVLCWAL